MNCQDTEKLLQLYIDDMLTAEEKQSVNEHLVACEHCAADYRELVALDALLKQEMADVVPPADLVAGVMKALPGQGKVVPLRKKKNTARRFAPMVAAAALIGMLGLHVFGDGAENIDNPNIDSGIIANEQEPSPFLQQNVMPEPDPIFAEVIDNSDPDAVVVDPIPDTDPSDDSDYTYSGDVKLPTVAYSSTGSGSFSQILLASYAENDALVPYIENNSTVIYYVKVDETIQKWSVNLAGGEEPVFVDTVSNMSSSSSVGDFRNETSEYGYSYYSAVSPDGTMVAANSGGEQIGILLYPADQSTEPQMLTSLGGGRLISWADNNKFLFTDENGLLHIYYLAEQRELLIYSAAVSSACWADDSRTIVFSGYDAENGHYNIYKVSVP